ncbi:hypothetical protein DsansV1_C20g0163351 [Dioscorea sansibarensis]
MIVHSLTLLSNLPFPLIMVNNVAGDEVSLEKFSEVNGMVQMWSSKFFFAEIYRILQRNILIKVPSD